MRESVKHALIGAATWIVVRGLLGVFVSGESAESALLAGVPGAVAFGVVYSLVSEVRD